MSDMVRRLMGQQRRRVVATVMTTCEGRSWWKKLTPGEQRDFKDDLNRSLGIYHDFMLDVVQVGGEDELRSERALILLESINQAVRHPREPTAAKAT